jgi:hypothetical protein
MKRLALGVILASGSVLAGWTAGRAQSSVFGRPAFPSKPGFTIYVGSSDKALLKNRAIELASSTTVIAFRDCSMVLTADSVQGSPMGLP